MMMGIGLSLSTTFAMEHSITDARVEFQSDERAMISFTFNNETENYYEEMYYTLFNKVTDIIEELKEVQAKMEEMCIEDKKDNE